VILGGLPGLVVILLVFCVWHASVALGVRRALAFLGITLATSWTLEEVGVLTGLVYGPYHYTSALGPWLGSVPVLIPLAWFALIYPTYLVVNLARGGWPVGTPGGRANLVGLALLGALLMAAWDLVIDPVLSGPTVGAWTWERGGPWYGVPVQNFLGWIATSFTIFLLYRSMERRSLRPAATVEALEARHPRRLPSWPL
jgi:putative membrane protein